jgi:hypothetical protein
VEEYLICENPSCRYLLSLRTGRKLLRPEELILNACPECQSKWSARCPFCLQSLAVVWFKVPVCSHCSRRLGPEVLSDRSLGKNPSAEKQRE